MARGFRSDTTTAMSARQADLIAVDVLSYGQQLERAVSNLQRKGISENDISFYNDSVAGYGHTPAENDNQKVFHPTGGGLTWQKPASNANDGTDWHFTGHSCVTGVGTGDTGCSADSSAGDEDLIAVLANMNPTVCAAIDKKLGLASIPANSGGPYSTTKFTGAFADGGTEINIGSVKNSACYSDGGNYDFYYVLIAR
jgi:hypothetical protein